MAEVVCDMPPAFLNSTSELLPYARVMVTWFHIVQTFTKALDDMC
ncbi:transposase [Cobetia amphilecti]